MMNKELNEIISAVRNAINYNHLQTYWKCLYYEVLPFLERLADEEVNQLIKDTKKILEKSEKPKTILGKILDNIVKEK